MLRTARTRRAFRWAVVLLAVLLVSCARPAKEGEAPCAITLRPGESLQEAIDRAPAGAVICLPAGTWTESIRITKPVSLRGAGPGKTKVRGAQHGQPVVWIGPLADDGARIVLAGISFGGASGPREGAHGLRVEGAAVVEIERCDFSANVGSAVFLRDTAHVTIRNSTVSNNLAYGVEAQDQARATLTASAICGNRSGGVWLSGTARLELAATTVSGSEGHGLWVRDSSELVATDATITNCEGHGIVVRDRASAHLTGCTISSHKDIGIWVEHAARATLVECAIEGTWDGVVVRDASWARIAACTISGVKWNGIEVGGSSRAEIVGSRISRGRGSGISLSGAAEAEIRDNRIEGWSAQGVLSTSRVPPRGEGNRMEGNGVDLVGNLPGSLRVPLVTPSQAEVRFPSPDYATLQEAADAVLPGGRLVLAAGVYPAGITLGQPIRIEAEGVVLLTGRSPHQSAVVSLVDGADLSLTGVAVGYGSDGLVARAGARAVVTDCVLSDNLSGIHAADSARVEVVRCRLSRNEQGGMWLWGRAHAAVRATVFTRNGVCGIGLGEMSAAVIADCHITESGWSGGIVVRDSAHAEIQGNSIVGNYGAGVALYHGLCLGAGYVFTGRIAGGGNTLEGNYKGDVCPQDLAFLGQGWGELDWRRERGR